MNRRKFLRAGSLFVPAFFARRALGQFTYTDLPYLAGQKPSTLINSILGSWALSDPSVNLQNGTITDQSGHGWTFTAPNTAIISGAGTGNINPCADFITNAASDTQCVRHFESTDSGLKLAANQQFTLSAWVNSSTNWGSTDPVCTGAYNPVFAGAYAANAGFIILGFPTSNFSCIVHDNGGNAKTASDTNAHSASTWYMVTGGWDGSNVWIQTNAGTRVTAAAATTNAATANFTIGSYATAVAKAPLRGFIGGVNLWTRSLSTTEVTALYNGGIGTTYPFPGIA